MKNLYQEPIWNYSDYNKGFYDELDKNGSKFDWSMPIGNAIRAAGCSVEHFADVIGETRDHCGRVKNASINKLNKEARKSALDIIVKVTPPREMRTRPIDKNPVITPEQIKNLNEIEKKMEKIRSKYVKPEQRGLGLG